MTLRPVFPQSGYALFAPPEEFDIGVAPSVVEELELLVEQSPWVAVDLSGVTFLDSTGLTALVSTRRRALVLGGDVVLVGAPPRVLRLLELTQLDRVFPVFQAFDDVSARPGAETPMRAAT